MNTKITFRTGHNIDTDVNGWDCETDYIIVGDGFSFEDWLEDNLELDFEKTEGDCYEIKENGEKTGEIYQILNEEPTEEELYW